MAASHELADRAAAVCRRPLPAKALREQLVALVRRAVPFGGYNFPLTDPVSRVATSPLADVPGLSWPRLPALICARYLTPFCRWDHLLEAGIAATSLLRETDGHPGVWGCAARGGRRTRSDTRRHSPRRFRSSSQRG